MNQFYLVGRRKENISGTQDEKNQQSGSLINQRKMFDKPKKNEEHPTMKPIPLLAYPIKN